MTSASQPGRSLAARVARGTGLMVLLRLSDRAIGLVSLAVLTRLLAPSDFGAVAIATAVLAMVEAFGQFGLDLALIRGQNRDRSAYDSAWTINLGIGLIVAAILAGLAIPAPAFFDDARLAPIFLWLALSVAIGGFENIGIVAFRKELAFDREFRFLLSGRVLGTAVAVAGAVVWGDYRALVVGVVARRVASVALSYAMHPFRPRLSLAGLGSLMQFSAWVMVQTILATINHRLPALLIGRWIGTSQVAFFTVAYEVATLATSEIMAPIRRVLYPAYAQIEADRQRFAVVIVDTLGVMALIGLPVAAGLALIATDVVHVMFGAQWLEAVPLVRILAIAGGIQCLGTSSHLVYLVLGIPRFTALLELVRFACYVPLVVLGLVSDGVVGAAWGFAAASAIVRVVDYALVMRVVRLRAIRIAAALLRPLAATALMILAVLLVQAELPSDAGVVWSLTRMVVSAAAGATVYIATVVALWLASGRPASAEERIVALLREWRGATGRRKR